MLKPLFITGGAVSALLVCSFVASFGSGFVHAQSPAQADSPPQVIDRITVTATPLGEDELNMAQPAAVLNGEELRRKRAGTIGDTLAQELGVQSSYFGPGSGRPVIRGLEAPRVLVLQDGIGSMDVSSISPDHGVTVESLNATQIEILRGPATLLYGSGAIGGLVNVVTNRVPRYVPDQLTGNVELRGNSVARERSGGFNLDGGGGGFAFHVDGFKRRSDEYRIPGRQVVDDPDSVVGRVPNSQVDSDGGAIGGSLVGARGYVGASVQMLNSRYGIPSEEAPTIDLAQTRTDLGGQLDNPFTGVKSIKLRVGHNDYQHQEIEASGAVGTTFDNKAWEGRLEVLQSPIAGWNGALGLQYQDRDFSALGEEAIIPLTNTRATGVFIVQEREWNRWHLDLGVRGEREEHRPAGDNPARSFDLGTVSVGSVWKFAEGFNVGLTATRAQRAPSIEELYSSGAHPATATFDVGDNRLRKETSRNVDLTLRKTAGVIRWQLNLFNNKVKDFVFGRFQDFDGDGVADRVDEEGTLDPAAEFTLQQFTQAGAKFYGAEAELTYQPAPKGFGMRVFADHVRGKITDAGNLPRIAPTRYGLELAYAQGPWSGSLTSTRVARQDRTAALETATPGYTRIDAEVAYVLDVGASADVTLFAQGTNLGEEDIRVHTSFLKDFAPLPGRSLTLGVRGRF